MEFPYERDAFTNASPNHFVHFMNRAETIGQLRQRGWKIEEHIPASFTFRDR
jgi:hypothetical protein